MSTDFSQSALDHLINIGVELSTEQDTTKLLEHILVSAKELSNADGGTIYSITEQKTLKFETLMNDTLGMYMGGTSGTNIPFPDIPMYIDGEPNHNALVAYAVVSDTVINIEDAYNTGDYDMSGARNMDEKTGYRTKSVLTIPMKNHEQEMIGVIQLINAQDGDNIIGFEPHLEHIIRSLVSMAAVALTNRQLIDGMEELFQSLTRLIARAIDEKSPYTGGHCNRVPELTMMVAEGVCRQNVGPLADFYLDEKDKYELSVAGWLHDCGKIATPEYVMDKATKLETIYDRISLVECRIELAKNEILVAHQAKIIDGLKNGLDVTELEQNLPAILSELDDDREFLCKANIGGEFMRPDDQQRVSDIAAKHTVTIGGVRQPLLTENEIYNLAIAKGTLTPEEREIINNHMVVTIDMLESLPFPKHLRNVTEYAAGHHEKMDGTGYPRKLKRDEMSVPARMMAIADIFEALTAADRPYKEPKKLSECLRIMGFMKLDQHIDPDLFDAFVDQEVYLDYAYQFISKEQIDEVDVTKIPGYVLPKDREYS
ncbi:GAF domain-containing protein [Psychrosphaera sp. B3R10]|uniref:HD domain-containing phosphohydrolase n=1 Tax=unclassified Psychrosphaera TaxID=2641570 RepID=UPI001C097E79|nr:MULTISPECIES: HD domain-containing phosphohydrolase [unclassified Psychrosphaera]MBU2882593.1 GAF domain-containing protein [Psychrosphaera sp. I2R16]MBU2989388.1 GAF domain-containing protein [Psychrosphaera sp. B3R10]